MHKYVKDNWDYFSSKHGVKTIEELAGVQGIANRNMTSETDADNFAAIVFATKPELYDELLGEPVEASQRP